MDAIDNNAANCHVVHWPKHVINKNLYQDPPRLSLMIRARRLWFAGDCKRRVNELVFKVVL